MTPGSTKVGGRYRHAFRLHPLEQCLGSTHSLLLAALAQRADAERVVPRGERAPLCPHPLQQCHRLRWLPRVMVSLEKGGEGLVVRGNASSGRHGLEHSLRPLTVAHSVSGAQEARVVFVVEQLPHSWVLLEDLEGLCMALVVQRLNYGAPRQRWVLKAFEGCGLQLVQ
eukprot:3211249-Rhodomonas_salina.1